MRRSFPSAARLGFGALLGISVWPLAAALLPLAPMPVRFLVVWLAFTFGAGAAIAVWLTDDLDPLRRTIVLLGVGTAATPVVIHLLGRAGALGAFPFVACAMGGIGVARWIAARAQAPGTAPRDLLACGALVLVALGTGAIAFAHRLQLSDEGIAVYGAYDSFDLSFYATWASEATHRVPPMASYYAGHQLNAAYYTQLVFAMVHRFAGVPLLSIYFRYAWPACLALGALTAFTLIRSLASTAVAALAVTLILIGGDLSYLAAWYLPHDTVQWDYLLWPTNFLAPTMEVLHFNTWAQALPVWFTALYGLVHGLRTGRWAWLGLAALLLGVLFQFKPFAYAVMIAALAGAAVFSFDWRSRLRFAATLVLSLACAVPFVYAVSTIGEDRRSRLLIDFFLLPQRMLLKLDLIDQFTAAAARLAPTAAFRRPVYLLLATTVFLIVGPGVRWLGAGGVWRALRSRDAGGDAAATRLLAWIVVAGVGMPFVLVTDPYVDTLQFYQTGLYVLWIFTALALARMAATRPALGVAATIVAVVLALPSSVHYLQMKWTDNGRPPLAAASRGEMAIADYLRTCDPERTVILHDRPGDASLIPVLSERRIVLGWGPKYYAVGSERRFEDVNRFYASASGDPDAALESLRRHRVTHVIVHPDRDRVHPDVLARLHPVLQTSDGVGLYAVPGF